MNQESSTTSEQPNRLVILRHHFPDGGNGQFFNHFDLMLQQDSKLATWQLQSLPELGQTVPAKRLPDHREAYLDYEGPVSGGRGSVEQIMAGTFEVCQKNDDCLEVLITSGDENQRLKIVSKSDAVTISRIAT